MAQKDYVSRSKKNGQLKKTVGKGKQSTATKSGYKTWLLLVVVVGSFIGGLYFLKTNKPAEPVTTAPQQTIINQPNNQGNSVPPLPEKRWGYLDELTNPGANRDISGAGMSAEQQRILAEMALDRPQQTATSSTYNEQVGRNSQSSTNQPAATANNPANATNTNTPNTPSTTATKPTTANQTNTATKSWTLQCGAFRNKEGAESIKAQLALMGISSQIIFSNNLHRVVIGPFSSQNAANSMQTRTQSAGISGCNVRG